MDCMIYKTHYVVDYLHYGRRKVCIPTSVLQAFDDSLYLLTVSSEWQLYLCCIIKSDNADA